MKQAHVGGERPARPTPHDTRQPITPETNAMTTEKHDLVTAGNIAKALGVSDAKVKKAIADLGVKPKAKKGVCNYYSTDVLAKVKKALN